MSAVESAEAPRVLLGLLLIEMGLISTEELEHALAIQKESGEPLGKVIVACGYASRLAIQDALARQSGFVLEPEQGYGTGLRTKLIEVEKRPDAPEADRPVLQLAPDLQVEPEPAPSVDADAIERVRAELSERERQVEELEQALAVALRERAELQDTLRERERRLDDLESQRAAEPSSPTHEAAGDFLAAVERARTHLAARRAQLREREQRLVSAADRG